MSTTSDLSAPAALRLGPTEQAVLQEEVLAFANALRDEEARERYLALHAAVLTGEIPPELTRALATMLELVLQTQRLRRLHGLEAERALTELYYQTERGAALRASVRETTQALAALEGQRIERLSLLPGPGRFTFVITTDRCRVTLRLDQAGARIENVEVGG